MPPVFLIQSAASIPNRQKSNHGVSGLKNPSPKHKEKLSSTTCTGSGTSVVLFIFVTVLSVNTARIPQTVLPSLPSVPLRPLNNFSRSSRPQALFHAAHLSQDDCLLNSFYVLLYQCLQVKMSHPTGFKVHRL